jgi:hypothetical protein
LCSALRVFWLIFSTNMGQNHHCIMIKRKTTRVNCFQEYIRFNRVDTNDLTIRLDTLQKRDSANQRYIAACLTRRSQKKFACQSDTILIEFWTKSYPASADHCHHKSNNLFWAIEFRVGKCRVHNEIRHRSFKRIT